MESLKETREKIIRESEEEFLKGRRKIFPGIPGKSLDKSRKEFLIPESLEKFEKKNLKGIPEEMNQRIPEIISNEISGKILGKILKESLKESRKECLRTPGSNR